MKMRNAKNLKSLNFLRCVLVKARRYMQRSAVTANILFFRSLSKARFECKEKARNENL